MQSLTNKHGDRLADYDILAMCGFGGIKLDDFVQLALRATLAGPE